MKKLLIRMIPFLLCAVALVALAGCGGYSIEAQVPHGEKGSLLFLGVNYNETYQLEDGVTIGVNFAHESVMAEGGTYAIYAGSDGSYRSVLSLPVDFATSEAYNTKSIREKEIVPGVVAYTCAFPQKAVDLTLPSHFFEGEAGSLQLVLASSAEELAGDDRCAYVFDYTVSAGKVTLSHGI